MAYYTKKQESEREDKVAELQSKIMKLLVDLADAEAQLFELRKKLIEAQERNRKLDWLLTEAVEAL